MEDPKIIAAFIAAIISVFISLTSWFLQHKSQLRKEEIEKSQRQDERFFYLYEHFYSDEMIVTRRKADKYLLQNENENYEFCIGYESGKNALNFSKVLHSFQRLAVACDTNQINDQLAKSYLYKQLEYWYNTHLKRFEKELNARNEFTQVLGLAKQWGIA